MKKTVSLLAVLYVLLCFPSKTIYAIDEDTTVLALEDSMQFQFLNYDTSGSISIGLGLARLDIPSGFKFLNAKQSQYVLTNLWGNPPSEGTLGMIFPNDANEVIPATWAIEISYEEDGHVKDDDANSINYDDLLKEMQKQIEDVNPARKEAGYPTFELTGWASPPFYDEREKKLHWAKRIMFEGDSSETLNYNIRILGRKGVLVLNAIGNMEQLTEIKSQINPILANVNFVDGNRYVDFDESIDKTAAYGIGGLIAGGVLLKTGLLAKVGVLLLKFIKPILIGGGIIVAAITKFFSGRERDDH